MKKLKKLLSIICVCCICISIAACGSGSSDSADNKGPSGASSSNSGPKSYSGKTLNVLLCSNVQNDAINSMIKDFEKLYDVKVNCDVLGRSNFDEKVIIELSSGSKAHDVYHVFGESLLQYVENDWLEPLDSYMADPTVANNDLLNFDDFSKGSIEACKFKDKLFGLPTYAATCIMYYRTDYFKQAGIDKVPATWDELVEACKKLKAIGVEPLGMRGNKAFGGSSWHLPMIALSFGGSVYKDFPNDMHPTVNSPEYVKAVKFYSDLLNNYGIEGATTCNYEDIILAVQQGNVGIWIDGAPLVTQYLAEGSKTTKDNIGFSIIPAGEKGVTAAQNTHMISIGKNAVEKELAYKFLEWACSEDIQLRASTEAENIGVTRSSVRQNAKYLEKNNYGDGAWAKAYQDCMDNAAKNYYPLNKEWPEVSDIITSSLSEVFTGKDAQKAMDEANAKIDALMKERQYYK